MSATITDDRSSAIVISAGITIFLSLLFVSFRTLIAVKKKIQVQWDDWFILAALVGLVFRFSFTIVQKLTLTIIGYLSGTKHNVDMCLTAWPGEASEICVQD